MMQNSIDLITDLDKTLRIHYTAGDTERVETVVAAIKNNRAWTAEELANELPALSALTAQMKTTDGHE